MSNWIHISDQLPRGETDCLISDGENVGLGYFVPEYEATDPKDPLQYSSEHWVQEGMILNTCCSGFPNVSYWKPLPKPPNEKNK